MTRITRRRVRRVLYWALAGAGLPLLWACQSYRLAPPDPKPDRVVNQTAFINPTQELDIVFMIDNSGSMAEEQANLTRNFPVFMRELQAASPMGLLDVHIGVISSNLGAASGSMGCDAGGDGGAFQNRPRANNGTCTAVPRDPFIIAGPAGNNFPGAIADVFSCIAALGIEGCGFEHQLASLRRALGKDPNVAMPPQNNGFLRPNARLGIILITDEDDCSAPPDTDLFRASDQLLSSEYGQQQSFRCNEFGHLCGGKPPTRMAGLTFNDCQSNETASSKLIHVSEFVSAIKSLKAKPDLIAVAAITGPVGPYKTIESTRSVDSTREKILEIGPSCSITIDQKASDAAPALRIHEFVSAFGAKNGIERSICTADFAVVMREIATVIAPPQIACIEQRLIDTDRTLAGIQPDCAVTQVVPRGVDSPIETVIPGCDRNGRMPPCWFLQQNPAQCPITLAAESLELKIDRGGVAPPADARLNYACAACAGTADPRCAP